MRCGGSSGSGPGIPNALVRIESRGAEFADLRRSGDGLAVQALVEFHAATDVGHETNVGRR